MFLTEQMDERSRSSALNVLFGGCRHIDRELLAKGIRGMGRCRVERSGTVTTHKRRPGEVSARRRLPQRPDWPLCVGPGRERDPRCWERKQSQEGWRGKTGGVSDG